jgi:hypothetical protein
VSKVKNISGGARYVPLLDREVEDGETVEVPDFQPGHTDADPLPIVWPEGTWEPVTDKPAVKASAAKPDATAAADTSGKAAS